MTTQDRANLLEFLENEENKIIALKKAINEGIDSGITENFNPKEHLELLKAKKRNEQIFPNQQSC